MFKFFLDVLVASLYETFSLLPYLYLTYLLMEYLEHEVSRKWTIYVRKSKQLGPVVGSFLGLVPQCGFSVSFANLYATGLISLGTMLAVFFSTSDEMLPILISEGVNFSLVLKILTLKFIYALCVGVLIDRFLPQSFIKNKNEPDIASFCKKEKCKCVDKKENIYKSAYRHTEKISIFIFLCAFVINLALNLGGYKVLQDMLLENPFLSKIAASAIGLIPSCYPSVLLTQLYTDNVISVATMLTGTLSNSGLGLFVLYKVNQNKTETSRIIALIFVTSVVLGILTELIL